jgi:hypothetical protein
MKNLFLTLALVLVAAFAFANTKNDVKTETVNKITVVDAELPTPVCIEYAFLLEDIDGEEMAYAEFDQLVRDCESW